MRRVVLILLLLAWGVWAGQPAKEKTLEFSGTAPVGAYTYPANFSGGRAPGAGKTMLGVEITSDQLTNPLTRAELVVEVSYDGGTSWPPSCVSSATCVCHNATQDASMPSNTDWCAGIVTGGVWTVPFAMECQWSRISDNQTRMRGRLNVCGAPATGTIYTTWR